MTLTEKLDLFATADFAMAIAIQNLVWGIAGPLAGGMPF